MKSKGNLKLGQWRKLSTVSKSSSFQCLNKVWTTGRYQIWITSMQAIWIFEKGLKQNFGPGPQQQSDSSRKLAQHTSQIAFTHVPAPHQAETDCAALPIVAAGPQTAAAAPGFAHYPMRALSPHCHDRGSKQNSFLVHEANTVLLLASHPASASHYAERHRAVEDCRLRPHKVVL
jgi:hypothetical protein